MSQLYFESFKDQKPFISLKEFPRANICKSVSLESSEVYPECHVDEQCASIALSQKQRIGSKPKEMAIA